MNQSMLLRIRESDTQIREPDTERMVPRFVLMIALLENKHRECMPVPARITEDKFSDGYSFEERELRPLLYECLWEIDYAVSNYI